MKPLSQDPAVHSAAKHYSLTVYLLLLMVLSSNRANAFLERNYTIPLNRLPYSIEYFSSPRFAYVFKRFLHGGSFKIGVVGGSVCKGAGTSPSNDWFSVFSQWLRLSIPQSTFNFRNGCVGGTQSSYMISCLGLHVYEDVDLVFVDYATNDHTYVYHGLADVEFIVRQYERLIRRILELPKSPAVVIFQSITPKILMGGHFYESQEDEQGALAQYYELPMISLRGALWHYGLFNSSSNFSAAKLYPDRIHPNDTGHHIMADLVIFFFEFFDRVSSIFDTEFRPDLPPPMFQGNEPPHHSVCDIGLSISKYIVSTTWVYKDEGSPNKPKPGFIGYHPHDYLFFKFDTSARYGNDTAGVVQVIFHYLKSYEHMGQAEFTCVSGCACSSVVVNGHSTTHASQTYLAELMVTRARNCTISIVILNNTESGEYKFKVSGVVVNDAGRDPAFDIYHRNVDANRQVPPKIG